MPLVHRETIEEQGVEAVLLDVGENHVELLAPLGDDTPVGKFLAKRGPGLHHVAYRVDDIDAALDDAAGRGPAADRRAAAHGHPRLAGRVPAPVVGRRSPDRVSPTRGGARMSDPTKAPPSARRAALGFHGGGQVLSLRLQDAALEDLRKALQDKRDGWYEVEATDGAVLVDLAQVVYLRVESGEHRVGF